ncbi:MAG: DUF2726 domain-containing protein [Caldimonas sp.]
MTTPLLVAAAVLVVLLLAWLAVRKRSAATTATEPEDRLDTLLGWAPESTQVMRPSERLAYTTLKLAMPGYMVLAQIPIARFVNVPKRNSYSEWMRRLGNQCVDLVLCDVTSQVVAVIDIRPPDAQLDERVRRRLERVARTLGAVGIPYYAWNQDSLPSVEAARASVMPRLPAVPVGMASSKPPAAPGGTAGARNQFLDTDRDWTHEDVVEVIEMAEPRPSTWFDELDSEPPPLHPEKRQPKN